MRIAKMIMNGENALLGGACKKFKVEVLASPVSTGPNKKTLEVCFTMILVSGEEKHKQSFFLHLKKQERIIDIDRKGNFIIGKLKENPATSPMYKYSLFHIEPIHISNTGIETWTIGSFDNGAVDKFIDNMDKQFKSKLITINNHDDPTISVLTVNPKLTSLQKAAMESAIGAGYYEYPRKTDIQEIANKMGISYSTFHAHLRKAEKKMIPFLFNRSQKR